MNNALRKMKTQQVSHLEDHLSQRGLPDSFTKAPNKIFDKAVQGPLKDRLELGLIGEPTVQQGAYSSSRRAATARATRCSARRSRPRRATSPACSPSSTCRRPPTTRRPTSPSRTPNKDPRAGIQLSPKTSGGFKATKVEGQDLADLKASTANRSFTVNAQGKVVDNAAPGYDQESLRAGGFIQ